MKTPRRVSRMIGGLVGLAFSTMAGPGNAALILTTDSSTFDAATGMVSFTTDDFTGFTTVSGTT